MASEPLPDPKGLLREAFGIDGIGEAECRSILLDWALALPASVDALAAVQAHFRHYAPRYPDHPMTALLREGLQTAHRPARRGGGRARRGRSGSH